MKSKKEELKHAIRSVMSTGRPVSLESGESVSTYFDIRSLVAVPKYNRITSELVLEMLEEVGGVDSLGGLAMGAIAICQGVAMVAYLHRNIEYNTFYVRKTAKPYALQKQVEGIVKGRVAVLDDVFKTGNSILEVKRALLREGVPISVVIPLVYRGTHAGLKEDQARLGLRILPVFMEEEFAP